VTKFFGVRVVQSLKTCNESSFGTPSGVGDVPITATDTVAAKLVFSSFSALVDGSVACSTGPYCSSSVSMHPADVGLVALH